MSVVRQVLFQTTGGHSATPASPDLVVALTIACFNADSGVVSAMDGAAPTEFFLVQGNADFPILSPVISLADDRSPVIKQLYVLPVKQRLNYTSVPVGPTGGAEYNLKAIEIVNPVERRGGSEPRYRQDYAQTVPASQTDEDSIYAFVAQINADPSRIINAGCNKLATGVVSSSTGILGVTIADPASGRSVTYTQAWNSSIAQTGADFVTNQAAAILAAFGVIVTFDTITLTFTGDVNTNGGGGDITYVDDGSGNVTMAAAGYTEATTLYVEALEQGTIFDTIFTEDGAASAAVKATTNAHVEGSGSPQQVLQLEQEAAGAYSNYYRETPQPLSPATYSGTDNFDLYTIRFKTNQDGQTPVGKHEFQELVLAIVDGLSGDLDTFFGI